MIKVTAFRGEHGNSGTASFQTRLGSLSFGDLETAREYALHPNNKRDVVHCPRLIQADLSIQRPVMNDEDAFIEFSILIDVLGVEKATRIALDLEGWVSEISIYEMVEEVGTLEEFLSQYPEKLEELYVQAWPVFDNPVYVEWFMEAGYDGAAFWGAGFNAMEMEYRVFDFRKSVLNNRVIAEGREAVSCYGMAKTA